ncbi:hypothetical protein GQ457_02G038060 [Hibiscus cannabinus]
MAITVKDNGVENSLRESTQIMEVSRKQKRLDSTDHEDVDLFSYAKRRKIIEAINEGIVQIGPDNWGDVGFGAMANDDWLQLAFFPKVFTTSEPFINIIEFKKWGMRFGTRRLSLIKNVVKRKHCLEVTRNAFENVEVIEQDTDPYGMRIDTITNVVPETSTNQIPNNRYILEDNVDDLDECHPRPA